MWRNSWQESGVTGQRGGGPPQATIGDRDARRGTGERVA